MCTNIRTCISPSSLPFPCLDLEPESCKASLTFIRCFSSAGLASFLLQPNPCYQPSGTCTYRALIADIVFSLCLFALLHSKKGYAGVTTWASATYSPVRAEIDCLGEEEEVISREGR